MDGLYFLAFQAAFWVLAIWAVQAERHDRPESGHFGIQSQLLGRDQSQDGKQTKASGNRGTHCAD